MMVSNDDLVKASEAARAVLPEGVGILIIVVSPNRDMISMAGTVDGTEIGWVLEQASKKWVAEMTPPSGSIQ